MKKLINFYKRLTLIKDYIVLIFKSPDIYLHEDYISHYLLMIGLKQANNFKEKRLKLLTDMGFEQEMLKDEISKIDRLYSACNILHELSFSESLFQTIIQANSFVDDEDHFVLSISKENLSVLENYVEKNKSILKRYTDTTGLQIIKKSTQIYSKVLLDGHVRNDLRKLFEDVFLIDILKSKKRIHVATKLLRNYYN